MSAERLPHIALYGRTGVSRTTGRPRKNGWKMSRKIVRL